MSQTECLGVSSRPRGVIPTKLSDLENDVKYVTEEDLEGIVFANQVGNYNGLSDESAEVEVDNLRRTISVKVKRSIEDLLSPLIPTDGNTPGDGNYVLKVTVVNGEPVFGFTRESSLLLTNYYYGNVSVEPKDLTGEIVESLSNGGSSKGNREYKYNTYKQRQVFAYPASFGRLSSIEHVQTGFNVTQLFTVVELRVNGMDYLAYISESSSTGEYTYRFKY